MAAKRVSANAKCHNLFGHARKLSKMFRAGLYARVSTNDQQTLPHAKSRDEGICRPARLDDHDASPGGGLRRRATRGPPETAGSSASPGDRRRAGLAVGPLGPVGNGPVGDAPGTGASWHRVHLAD